MGSTVQVSGPCTLGSELELCSLLTTKLSPLGRGRASATFWQLHSISIVADSLAQRFEELPTVFSAETSTLHGIYE